MESELFIRRLPSVTVPLAFRQLLKVRHLSVSGRSAFSRPGSDSLRPGHLCLPVATISGHRPYFPLSFRFGPSPAGNLGHSGIQIFPDPAYLLSIRPLFFQPLAIVPKMVGPSGRFLTAKNQPVSDSPSGRSFFYPHSNRDAIRVLAFVNSLLLASFAGIRCGISGTAAAHQNLFLRPGNFRSRMAGEKVPNPGHPSLFPFRKSGTGLKEGDDVWRKARWDRMIREIKPDGPIFYKSISRKEFSFCSRKKFDKT